MSPQETKALWAFADKHGCLNRDCLGCIGESKCGCVHPEHPLLNKPDGQALDSVNEVAAHA